MVFAQTSLDRGDLPRQAYNEIASVIQSFTSFVFVFFETDATVPTKDGRFALNEIMVLSKRKDLSIIHHKEDKHVGICIIHSNDVKVSNKPLWIELSGPKNPRGKAGGYKHHLLELHINSINGKASKIQFTVVAAHQISIADVRFLDPFNSRERRRQSRFILQYARSLTQNGHNVIVMRDVNDFLYFDRIAELHARKTYGFFSPTDTIDTQKFNFGHVKISPGKIHWAIPFVKPFFKKPILKLLKINTNIDSICIPQELRNTYKNKSSYTPVTGLDHGILQFELLKV